MDKFMLTTKLKSASLLSELLLLLALCTYPISVQAAPKADLWSYWLSSDEMSNQKIDHSQWQAFLDKYVSEEAGLVSLVRYSSVSYQDQRELDTYVEGLSSVDILSFPRDEQFAFWINLYNALTVQLILKHYPIESIKKIDISPGWFSSGPWGKKLVVVAGEALSLDDIEHRILRPIWKDPRIHYAVNCASLGCPDLNQRAYDSVNIEKELTRMAKKYINHPRGVTVVDGVVRVSSIYKWFRADFGDSEMAVLEHIRSHASSGLRQQLEGIVDISDYEYDWSLNDYSTSGRSRIQPDSISREPDS